MNTSFSILHFVNFGHSVIGMLVVTVTVWIGKDGGDQSSCLGKGPDRCTPFDDA